MSSAAEISPLAIATLGSTTGAARPDGRRVRGERTRQRIVDALILLVEEGDLRPSAQRVAERAGVALRTVYHHFADVDALRSTALRLQGRRHLELLAPIDPGGPVDERVASVVQQRRSLFEALTPIRRATLLDEEMSPAIAEELEAARVLLRNQLALVFSGELTGVGGGEGFLDALDVVTSWQTWNFLRTSLHRDPEEASVVLRRLLSGAVAEAAHRHDAETDRSGGSGTGPGDESPVA